MIHPKGSRRVNIEKIRCLLASPRRGGFGSWSTEGDAVALNPAGGIGTGAGCDHLGMAGECALIGLTAFVNCPSLEIKSQDPVPPTVSGEPLSIVFTDEMNVSAG